MKGIKPSEFLDQRDNLQKFVDYILVVGLPDCRGFALSITRPKVNANGEFFDMYTEACTGGGFTYAQYDLMMTGNRIMELIAEAIRNYLGQRDVPIDNVSKWNVSRRVAKTEEFTQALYDMAIYLVPGERIAISAVNQILFGGDDSLKGEFGHAFSDAMRSIMIAADRIAEEMLNEYEERKAHE